MVIRACRAKSKEKEKVIMRTKKIVVSLLCCLGLFCITAYAMETKKISMSYTECLSRKEVVVSQLGVRASDIIPIVNSSIMNVTKYCTLDGSIILTCSKPDNSMIIVSSPSKCR